MSLTFYIPSPLREFTGGKPEIELELHAATAADALAALWGHYPGLRDRIVTEQGAVREHVSVFVNDENIRFTGGLSTPIPENAEIHVIPAISGG